eukprot:c11240_g1_i1 orf=2-331(-)
MSDILGARSDQQALLDTVREHEIQIEETWRLNFNGFQRPSSLPSTLHSPQNPLPTCLKRLGSVNRVDEYYQQQEQILEKFTEIDALTGGSDSLGSSKEEQERVARGERIA